MLLNELSGASRLDAIKIGLPSIAGNIARDFFWGGVSLWCHINSQHHFQGKSGSDAFTLGQCCKIHTELYG